MDPGDDGTVGVHADIVRELSRDCDEATVQQALALFTRQSAAPFVQPPLHIPWQHMPSSYFVCTEDLGIHHTEMFCLRARLERSESTNGHRLLARLLSD